ncbi:MAG: hypothetical protein II723_01915, partial [Oscillospiraceae bacterium]|nr:hypothetical protein [Oscillospiraceae bacterium]
MADEKNIRSSADRDADAALEEILREVEASPRRTAKRRESDDLDFVQTGTPRSHAATPKTPARGNPEPAQESRMPEREKPRRENPGQKAPVRRNAEQAPQRRRPEEQRANGQQNRVRRDVEQVDAPPRRAPQQRPQNGGQQRAPHRRPEGQQSRPQRPQEPQRRSQPQREPVQQHRQ